MFRQLCAKNPEHIWFSPTCGPWSAWSQFNGQRSISAWEDLLTQRLCQLEQVALGIVLFRRQKERHRHFHWEQPARSLMFKMPYLSEVFAYSQCAEFDMCNVGDLTDPQSGKPIKKGMIVVTTSPSMHKMLHGRYCVGHEHIGGLKEVPLLMAKVEDFPSLLKIIFVGLLDRLHRSFVPPRAVKSQHGTITKL